MARGNREAADQLGPPSPPREAVPESSPRWDDVLALRACIRDLVSFSALPAMWSASTRNEILAGMADALATMLRLDVVYAWLDGSAASAPIEVVRLGAGDSSNDGNGLAALVRGAAAARSPTIRSVEIDGQSIRLDVARIGIAGQTGGVIGGAARSDFPSALDSVLLSFAANQTAIALRGAGLLEREREARAEVETVHRVGQVLSAELDLRLLVQAVTDATTELTGAEFGSFFYNVLDDRGESYTLYALSGTPREAFEGFPMPRNTAVFGPTFRGEGVLRFDDVRRAPGYGQNSPYHGMPPGHLPVVSYLAVPVVSRSGEVLGGLFFGHSQPGRFTDRHENIVGGIAAQTAIAIDNARLYESARDAIRTRDEFLSVASHELKTPVTGVKGSAQLLQRMLDRGAPDEQHVNRLISSIIHSSNRLTALVDDLLDVSRIRSGQLALHVEPTAIADLLRRVVSDYEVRLDRRYRLRMDLTAKPCVLPVDVDRLEQVLVNLLDNAIKYSPDGGLIHIQLVPAQGAMHIAIRDEGIGLPPDALELVFQPFGRAANATSRHLPGMGLGLHICRSIVEQHGGRLWVESAGDGRGATFIAALPYSPTPSAEPDDA